MSSQLPTALAVTFALIISPNVSAARAQEKSLTCRTRFNGDALKGAIKALHAAGKTYDEHVTEPDIHISGNTAWIAYVNKGSITDASGTVNQNWLESAFLEKQAGTWKIVSMHSTRVPMATQENQRK